VLLIGCTAKKEDGKLNDESIAIHNSMVKKAGEMKSEFLFVKSDSASDINKDSIDVLLFDLEQWENDLVEVPGNESDHHDEHHHDHHNPAPEVTASQMLQIQQELDKRLKIINKRASDLLNHSQK
jgi:hypothetical protein